MLTEAVVKRARHSILAGLVLGLAGCASVQPETVQVVAQPKTPPVRNLTSFSGALDCMDNLFLTYGVRDKYITSAGIPDATGEIRTGTREMLISAVSRMSTRSSAFRYVDYDPNQIDVHELHQLIDSSESFFAPDNYIRGAVTQLDQNVTSENVGAGISISDFLDLGIDKSRVISLVSLDMNLADFVSRQIMPGISSANSIAVIRSAKAADAGGRIKKAGVFFNISLDKSEGVPQAVRTLVELGAIELLGKFTQVPYWTCLQIESTNPEVQSVASGWYSGSKPKERILFVQRALKGAGYYGGPVNGLFTPALSDAITIYQTERRLVPNGRLDFPLYMALLDTDKRLAAGPSIAEGDVAKVRLEKPLQRRPVELTVLTDKGAKPAYRVGEALSLQVQTSGNAYLYCYYRDAQGLVARIYPNRFQPDALIVGNKPQLIPSPQAPFSIRFDRPGAREEIACVASDRELAMQLPPELKTEDLAPLPVASIDDLLQKFRTIDKTGLAVERLPITVN